MCELGSSATVSISTFADSAFPWLRETLEAFGAGHSVTVEQEWCVSRSEMPDVAIYRPGKTFRVRLLDAQDTRHRLVVEDILNQHFMKERLSFVIAIALEPEDALFLCETSIKGSEWPKIVQCSSRAELVAAVWWMVNETEPQAI
ncbi:hypothetical protein FOZ62_030334 [Perkinsus olseni]|uniref:Uncharacterized protein n=1 Tax=Perkinsus olseni TaxID=32597 RepID=A0A7J6NCQ0_PEROL|nr:hypothetical protein FOZ62_030334 [Perkinsus olseni]